MSTTADPAPPQSDISVVTVNRRRLRPNVVTGIFVVLGVVSIWLQNVIVPFREPFWGLFDNQLDLEVYRAGARTVLDGHRLYEAKLLGVMDYTYAPISVVLFTPVALISFDMARIAWTVAVYVVLYAVIVMSFRALRRPITWRLRIIAVSLVAIAALAEPVRSTLWFGQVNIFLMAMILWDLLRPRDSRGQGFVAGLAAGIKLTPLIFVAHLLITGRRRAALTLLAGFASTIAVAAVAMPRDTWTYWSGTFLDSDRVGIPNVAGNQSLRGALANLLDSEQPPMAAWLALALPALALGLCAARLAHTRGHELLALTLIGMTACVVSPMTWGHHWVWFVPLGVIGVDQLLRTPVRGRTVVAGIAVGALLLVTFSWRTYIPGLMFYVEVPHLHAYYTGLFFKNGIGALRWFTVAPYSWVFLVTAVATVLVLRRTPAVTAGLASASKG